MATPALAAPVNGAPQGTSGGPSATSGPAPPRAVQRDGGNTSLGTFGVSFVCITSHPSMRTHTPAVQVKSGLAQMLKVSEPFTPFRRAVPRHTLGAARVAHHDGMPTAVFWLLFLPRHDRRYDVAITYVREALLWMS